jgi:hypothetical protein
MTQFREHEGALTLDLADSQWDAVLQGEVASPDGTQFRRRSTRTKRKDCDALIAEGVPVVLYYWAGGQLDWLDPDEAKQRWPEVRPAVTSEPTKPRGELQWTAGIWTSDDGSQLLFLSGAC